MATTFPTTHSSSARLEALRNEFINGLAEGTLGLPVLPEFAGRVISLTNDPKAEIDDLTELIEQDPTLAANVLRFANSAAYYTGQETVSLTEAIMRLGMRMVCGIAIAVCLESKSFQTQHYSAMRRRILIHALIAGGFARELARHRRINVERVFLCGLLHSIGKPVVLRLITDVPGPDNHILRESDAALLVEEFHTTAAAAATAEWKLPRYVQIAATHYREPGAAPEFAEETRLTALASKLAGWAAENNPADEEAVRVLPEWEDLEFEAAQIDAIIEHGRMTRRSSFVSLA
jgi:HD-like signal output (HDOD) protein